MNEMIGAHLGKYSIGEKLGEGGMGSVFKATDDVLNRIVALKVLPHRFATTSRQAARFEREAQAAGRLNHPNVATIFEYGSGVVTYSDGTVDSDPIAFISMEYVEGVTLADLNNGDPIDILFFLDIAVQAFRGLGAAHRFGILHRDIKSANIMIDGGGLVKILDFGLAKSAADPTVTEENNTVGTLAFMSPEQLMGNEVTASSDVFSMGVVLYELLTGVHPFSSSYSQAIAYSIVNEDPVPTATIRPDVDTRVGSFIDRLLEKDQLKRPSDTASLVSDLEEILFSLKVGVESGVLLAKGHRFFSVGIINQMIDRARPFLPNIRQFALLSVLIGLTWALARSGSEGRNVKPDARQNWAFSVTLNKGESISDLARSSLIIDPQERNLAYVVDGEIRIRPFMNLDQVRSIPNTINASSIFYSPDGSRIGYVDRSTQWIISTDLEGEDPQRIALLPHEHSGLSWGYDGYIYVAMGREGIARVAEDGGDFVWIIRSEIYRHAVYSTPSLLHGRPALLYSRLETNSWQEADLRIFDLESSVDDLLIESASNPVSLPDGSIFFARRDGIYRLDRALPGGARRLIDSEVRGASNQSGVFHFSVSNSGTVVRLEGSEESESYQLIERDSTGTPALLPLTTRNYQQPTVFQSRPHLAILASSGSEYLDLWISDDYRNNDASRITNLDRSVTGVAWSEDPGVVYYSSSTNEGSIFYRLDLNKSLSADTLLQSSYSLSISSYSGRNRAIICDQKVAPGANSDICSFNLDEGTIDVLTSSEAEESHGSISPSGRWLVFQRLDGPISNIYVQSLDPPSPAFRLTQNGGSLPKWSFYGDFVYFVSTDHFLSKVSFFASTGRFGSPVKEMKLDPASTIGAFELSGDSDNVIIRQRLISPGEIDPLNRVAVWVGASDNR